MILPKDKAKELRDMFLDNLEFSECYRGSLAQSKQCALMMIECIIDEFPYECEYWINVKNELLDL